ncbi:50S ribosomal protein L21, partial [bacterium]|nr:50S ribosomal protein L21 [bacterium]
MFNSEVNERMYAVVEIAGMQWKVNNAQILRVPKIDGEPGSSVEFDQVMLVVDQDEVQIGQPIISNVKVKATVLSHGKAKKVKVFKKKRRKNYNVMRGHRQEYTELRIDQIGLIKEDKKASAVIQEKPVKDVASDQIKKTVPKSMKIDKKTSPDMRSKKKRVSAAGAGKSQSQKMSASGDIKTKKGI